MILIIFQCPKVDGQSYVIFICMIFLHCIVAPEPKHCPKLQGAVFTYTYHCCAFEAFAPPDWHKPSNPYVPPITELPSRIGDVEEVTTSPDTKDANASYVCEFYRQLNISGFCPEDETTL